MKSKKLLSFLLATVITISLLPTFTLTASAATTTTTEKNIMLGTSALSGYDKTKNKYDYVYYGTYYGINSIKWRILTMNGNDGTYKDSKDETVSSENAMFLLSEYVLKEMAYEKAYNSNDGDRQLYPSDWRYSDAWDWCNDTNNRRSFISYCFTDLEKAHFLKTSKNTTTSKLYTDQLLEDTFFFLSKQEADSSYIENNRVAKMSNKDGNAVIWWLRTPSGSYSYYVYRVRDNGLINDGNVGGARGFRPAFNLNLSSILFTSAAVGGKSSTAEAGGGAELFENVNLSTLTNSDGYKLTMLDETRKDFSASLKSLSGNTATISYSGAKTGANEYISVIIKNGENVKYYGRACTATSSSGETTFTLPNDFNEANGDLLCVFNEQYNGDYKTDYASNFITVVTTGTGLKNAEKSDGTVVLGKDITISETLEIDKNIILDLAGFTLTKTGSKTNYGVIKTNTGANFTLKDSSTAQTGTITGGNATTVGCVFVGSNSTFVMESGTICGCTGDWAGGVWNYGTFTIKGGKIFNCISPLTGGVYNNGVFNMNGGSISGCNGTDYGSVINSYLCTIKNDSITGTTVCYDKLTNIEGTIEGKLVEFKDGDTTYAWELIPDGGTAVIPENPTKAGCTLGGWYEKVNGEYKNTAFDFDTAITTDTTLYAQWTAIPANAATVSGSDIEVTYGQYTNKKISVTVTSQEGYTYSYQWYDSSKNTISGETESSYTVPNDLTAGSHDYYCVVTAKRSDNGETASSEKKINVKVNKGTATFTEPTAQNDITYGAKLSSVGLTEGWTWVDDTIEPTVINSGYKAYYTPADTSNYDWTVVDGWNATENRVERTVRVTVCKTNAPYPPMGCDGIAGTIDGKADCKITGVTTEMEYRKEGETNYIPISGTEITGLEDGKYYIRYKATDNYYASEDIIVTIDTGRKLTVTVPTTQVGYRLTVNKTALVWNDSVELTFTLAEGYSKLDTFAVNVNGDTVTLDANGKYTVTDVQSDITVTVVGVADVTAPKTEIRLGDNSWNKFYNSVNFDLYFKDTQKVTITASDMGSGVDKVYYYLSTSALTEEQVKALSSNKWTEYTGEFNLITQDEYIIYAKAADKDNNVKYISSEKGIVIDSIAPVITGIENGETHYGDTTFEATDKHLKEVKVDGNLITLTDGKYTITADGQEHTVVVTDKANNSTKVKITVISIASLDDSIESITTDNVKSSDKKAIEDIQTIVNGLIAGSKDFTDIEDTELANIKANTETLLEKIDKVADSYKTDNTDKVKDITSDNVKTKNKKDLEAAENDLEKALKDYKNNLTGDEKKDIQDEIDRIEKALKVIDKVEKVENLINKLSANKAKLNANAIKKANDAYNALSKYEQSIMDKDAKNKLASVKKSIEKPLKAESDNKSPQTDDNSNIALWFALLFISCVALTSTTVYGKKKKR